MSTTSMNLTPAPVYDAAAIRQAREASSTGGAPVNTRPRSNTGTSPRPQPYPLIRTTASPYPSLPAAHSTTVATSLSITPTNVPSVTAPVKQETVIDPALIALDAAAPPTTDPKLSQQLGLTQPLEIPFQAPLFNLTDTTASPAELTPVATAPSVANPLARRPLTLQTQLDSNRFATQSGGSSSTSSYPPGSVPVSEGSSPVTPLSDGDAGSAYDPELPSPAFRDDSEGGVPAPKVKPKKSHARKQPEGHVKRARNAFILFRKHITDSNLIPTSVEVKHQNISVVAAKMWREAPQDVRAKFQEMARLEKEEHQRKYPNYRYQPVFRRTDIIRRRVRKDGTEDEKVEAVAEALINGKAGGELEKEIKKQALVSEEVDTSPESSAARSRSRRRRDPGQLSKGAQRALKAQNRQKAMRQNLLGHNLLNMSLYNAAQQQQEQHRRAMLAQQQAHAHGAPGYEVAYHPAGHYGGPVEYMPAPMGYEDGRGMVDVYGNPVMGAYEGYGQEYSEEMYLPSMATGYDDRPVYPDSYYPQEGMELASPYGPGPSHGHAPDGYMGGYDMPDMEGYTLPPLLHHVASPSGSMEHGLIGGRGFETMPTSAVPGGSGLHARVEDDEDVDSPRARIWGLGRQEQQMPSGHVMFNEGLFEGELGGMGMGPGGKDLDGGLGDFEEAIQQANEMW